MWGALKYLESIGGSRVGAVVSIDELVNANIIMWQCQNGVKTNSQRPRCISERCNLVQSWSVMNE